MPDSSTEFKRTAIILAGLTILAVSLYLTVSFLMHGIGFPLDDAWIHQTYARSFAQTGRWEFFPGQSSAGGSTAPLWSLLLAAGHLMRINLYAWSFCLGAVFLWGSASLAEWTVRRLVPAYHPGLPVVGMVFIFEWHLVWAAVSGMETGLFVFLVTLFFWLLFAHPQKSLALGLTVGLSVWVRPDGSTLLAPLFLSIVLSSVTYRERLNNLLKSGLGFALLGAPYLIFNLASAGALFPNTFYAKQTEYAALQSVPFIQRLSELTLQPLIGTGLFFLPAGIYWLYRTLRGRDWSGLAVFLWAAGFIGLYAARLPVSYQHGRYEMPVIPALLLLGCLGGASWLTGTGQSGRIKLFKNAWALATGLICILFLGMGAWSYARDVAYINTEMVDTAQWVAVNIPPGKLIAAHDIGALGYFGGHQIIDLAGLISPEIIPLMGDQAKIARYLERKNVDYLVTFPNWYPDLVKGKKEIYSSNSTIAETYGGENMAVYPWK